jgi:hypothetical protein
MSGSGLCPLSMLRHLANLQALTLSVKESRPSQQIGSGLQRLHVIFVLPTKTPPPGQDNSCALRGHLLTVEMLPDPARDGPYS